MPDDATLVERCLRGDTGAFDALVARYRDRVFSLAFRMLGEASAAEDAMQESFLRAYTRRRCTTQRSHSPHGCCA